MTRTWGEEANGLLCAETRDRDPRAQGWSVSLATGQTCASFPHATFSGSWMALEGGANCETSSLGKKKNALSHSARVHAAGSLT